MLEYTFPYPQSFRHTDFQLLAKMRDTPFYFRLMVNVPNKKPALPAGFFKC
ncbi:hypothetical protein CHCC20335_1851 [Bacillus paralicheniformis]|nr:hypothetical protein CHCC20335_1851 [Bacillus paralicheniformis]